MEPINTRCRRNSDLISTLPDHVLHHVMGFVTAKQAAQTCVLSRRWKYLWTSLQSFDCNSSEFHPLKKQARLERWSEDEESEDEVSEDDSELEGEEEESEDNDEGEEEQESESEEDQSEGEEEESEEDGEESEEDGPGMEISGAKKEHGWRFVKFVNTLLLRRDPLDLNAFRLSCDASYSEHVTTWIHYVVKHYPRVLHLCPHTSSLPSCIFICASLKELCLSDCGIIRSGTVNLPNLRIFFIRATNIVENQLVNMLSGCPLLEFLWLENCKFDDSVFAHEKLQHLTIINCAALSRYSLPCKAIGNMPSLTYACLDFVAYPMIQRWTEMPAFLSGLVNVEILKMQYGWATLEKGVVLPELPKFQKLHDLSIGVLPMNSCFGWLAWILESLPNLRRLTVLQDRKCYTSSAEVRAMASGSSDSSLKVAISMQEAQVCRGYILEVRSDGKTVGRCFG